MNLTRLFSMQKELDHYIQTQRTIEEDVFDRKLLALLVELGELANETRCFKFWSDKGPSERDVILEEYVDSIHFLLSIGLEKGWEQETHNWPEGKNQTDLNAAFLHTYQTIATLQSSPSHEHYMAIWKAYAEIARLLGFSTEDVMDAYQKKNEINYERQQSGY